MTKLRLFMVSFSPEEADDINAYMEEHGLTELQMMDRCRDAVLEMIAS